MLNIYQHTLKVGGRSDEIANVWTLFHKHCQVMEGRTSVVRNTSGEDDQISDLEKYLLAVQKTDQSEKKTEA